MRHDFLNCNTVKPLARHVHQTRFSSDLLDVRHGFHRCNSVKPLARHVHQKRFSSGLLDVIFINRFIRFSGKAEDHDRNRR